MRFVVLILALLVTISSSAFAERGYRVVERTVWGTDSRGERVLVRVRVRIRLPARQYAAPAPQPQVVYAAPQQQQPQGDPYIRYYEMQERLARRQANTQLLLGALPIVVGLLQGGNRGGGYYPPPSYGYGYQQPVYYPPAPPPAYYGGGGYYGGGATAGSAPWGRGNN